MWAYLQVSVHNGCNNVWNVATVLCSQPQALDARTSYGWGSQGIHRQAWVNLGNILMDYMLPFDMRGTDYNIL